MTFYTEAEFSTADAQHAVLKKSSTAQHKELNPRARTIDRPLLALPPSCIIYYILHWKIARLHIIHQITS